MKKITFYLLLLPLIGFAQIELKGSLTTGNSGTDVWEYIDPTDGKVYAVIGGSGMSIVDVTDPANPVEVAHITGAPGFDVKVWQNYVYCVTGGGGTAEIYDISDPSNPLLAGTWPSSHNIHIDERGYLYASSPNTKIYDLNPDPTLPQFLTEVGTEGHDVTVRGDRMLDAHGFAGTYIYDVSDPSNPTFLTIISDPTITYHHQGDFSTDGHYIYICDELGNHPQADISVWDISDLGNPVRVDDVADPNATPHNLYVIGDYAYTSYYTAGFRVFDISNPATLVLADEYDTSTATGEGFAGAFGVYPSPVTGNIYINDGSGVYIFGFDGLLDTSNNEVASFNVFPNPSSDVVQIASSTRKIDEITLYSSLGNRVFSATEMGQLDTYRLDVSNLAAGIYYLQVNNSETQKLIVR